MSQYAPLVVKEFEGADIRKGIDVIIQSERVGYWIKKKKKKHGHVGSWL